MSIPLAWEPGDRGWYRGEECLVLEVRPHDMTVRTAKRGRIIVDRARVELKPIPEGGA